MRLSWHDLGTARADRADGRRVEITGFALGSGALGGDHHFLMMAEPGCCQGCAPNNPLAVVEVFTESPLKSRGGALRLSGIWRVSPDAEGWRYRLHEAQITGA